MGLTEYKIGSFVHLYNQKCNLPSLLPEQVSGVGAGKEFFEPSKQVGSDTSSYKIVPNEYFACNLMHVGRDKVLPIAVNHSGHEKIVSPAYTVFALNDNSPILDNYFMMALKSQEQDRYFWFHTDSSVRDGMSWSDFCSVSIPVPDIKIQQKYVNIYNAMLRNQEAYSKGLDDLKMVCDAYIDNLKSEINPEPIGKYLALSDTRNDITLGPSSVRGLATSKEMINTKANLTGVSLDNYKVAQPFSIAYVPDTSRRGDKVSLAMNDSEKPVLVSSISTVFSCNTKYLLPEYLMMFFNRSEFDRYARFHSWGSARETFDWSEMCNVRIPIPDITVQQYIVNIFKVYKQRKRISERINEQILNICPVLIRGAIQEGARS